MKHLLQLLPYLEIFTACLKPYSVIWSKLEYFLRNDIFSENNYSDKIPLN